MTSPRVLLEGYSRFVSHHTLIVLAAVIVITAVMVVGSSLVGTKYMETRDVIPEDLEVIRAFNLLEDDFGSERTLMIAVEIDPAYMGSNEARDVRDPDVIRYLNLLSSACESNGRVETATSPATILRSMNNGILPQSSREIIKLTDSNPLFGQYISPDYTMALVRMSLVDIEVADDDYEIVTDIQEIVDEIQPPPGVITTVAGGRAVGPVVMELVGPDIARTFQASSLGIIIVSFLVYLSLRYGITPLTVIYIGLLWAMGIFGYMGLSLSAETSGTISMIMGIGIDFGIQITSRFRDEVKRRSAEGAMEITMNNVFMPMATTTLAALIGFRAMSMGQLKFFGEFGDIMSIGIAASFLVAITLVPVILVQGEKLSKRFRRSYEGSRIQSKVGKLKRR